MKKNGTRKRGEQTPLSKGEKRRLRQLVVCLVLFAAVFAGRGMDLGPVSRLSETVGELVEKNTDFQAVFSQVGESFSKGEPAVETFRSFWTGVFDPQDQTDQEPAAEDQEPVAEEEAPQEQPAEPAEANPPAEAEGGEDSGTTGP